MKGKETKNILVTIIKYITLLIIIVSIYMLLMIFSSLIPQKLLTKHVKESSEVLVEEGEKKHIDLGYKTEDIFTFTDALMINTAYSAVPEDPLAGAMLGRKNYIPGQTTKIHMDSQYNLGACDEYINEKNGDLYQTKELYDLMHGANITDSFEYARYWHGYITILKPLLILTNYSGIRIIFLIITILLLSLLLYKLYKKLNIQIAIIFLIGFLSISIFAVSQGINEILVYIISLIFSIVLLYKKDLQKNLVEMFFVVGSITNFFDLLTAPLVTLGIPLIICILLLQKENNSLKDIFIKSTKICISWCLAYGLTWIMKWFLTQLIYGRPIIAQSIEQARFRTGVEQNIEFIVLLSKVKNFLSKNVFTTLVSLIIVYIICKMLANRKEKIDFKQNIKNAIPYIITMFFPIIWYLVLKQHSYIHTFFTYRIIIISIISIFIIIYKLYEKTDNKMSKINDEKN